MFRAAILAIGVMFAGVLSAQATTNSGGTVNDSEQSTFLVEVDFGSTAQSITLSLDVTAVSGSGGLYVRFYDLDGLASGAPAPEESKSLAGLGTTNLSMTTETYSGVHEFLIDVGTQGDTDQTQFDFTLDAAALTAGSLTVVDTKTYTPESGKPYTLYNRIVAMIGIVQSAGVISSEFSLDFGASPISPTLGFESSGLGDASVSFVEVQSGGTTPIHTYNGNGLWADKANLAVGPHSGVVTFRADLDPSTTGLFFWQVALPKEVTVDSVASGSSGTSSDSSSSASAGGCVATGYGNSWIVILLSAGILALIGLRKNKAES